MKIDEFLLDVYLENGSTLPDKFLAIDSVHEFMALPSSLFVKVPASWPEAECCGWDKQGVSVFECMPRSYRGDSWFRQ